MDLLKNTIYINLDHREDRKQHVETEFVKLGIEAQRLKAIKTANGCVGCTMSHIKCLELAKQNNWPQVFICEDDISFTNPTLFLENLSKFQNTGLEWDVIIVSGNNCPPFYQIADFCIRPQNVQCLTGYIVNNKFYDILLTNFKEGLQQLIRDPTNKREYAVDMYWKRLQQIYNFFMIIPPTVVQYSNYSDIEEKEVDYSNMMLDLDKKALIEYYQKLQQIQEQQQKQTKETQEKQQKIQANMSNIMQKNHGF